MTRKMQKIFDELDIAVRERGAAEDLRARIFMLKNREKDILFRMEIRAYYYLLEELERIVERVRNCGADPEIRSVEIINAYITESVMES